MTRKEEFNSKYEEMVSNGSVECISLFIRMPSGELELIVNDNVENKVNYINSAYNDDLVHNNSDKIVIENYDFTARPAIFDFPSAIKALKGGHRVMRKGWNGKGMWLGLCVPENKENEESQYKFLPYIVMKTADNGIVPWLANQTDMLAEDWEIFVVEIAESEVVEDNK